MKSFMVFSVWGYLKGAVNLLCQHNSRKLVRESHFRHRKLQIGGSLDLVGYSARASYNKGNAASSCRRRRHELVWKSTLESCFPSMHMAIRYPRHSLSIAFPSVSSAFCISLGEALSESFDSFNSLTLILQYLLSLLCILRRRLSDTAPLNFPPLLFLHLSSEHHGFAVSFYRGYLQYVIHVSFKFWKTW